MNGKGLEPLLAMQQGFNEVTNINARIARLSINYGILRNNRVVMAVCVNCNALGIFVLPKIKYHDTERLAELVAHFDDRFMRILCPECQGHYNRGRRR